MTNINTSISEEKFKLNILEFLRRQSNEYHKKENIKKCKTCRGTGLLLHYGTDINYWDSRSYCSDCNGFGYSGLNDIDKGMIDTTHFVCKKCGGSGCDLCNYKGIVDWVTNAMGVK